MQRQDFQQPVGGDIIFSIVNAPAVAPIEDCNPRILEAWEYPLARMLRELTSSARRQLNISLLEYGVFVQSVVGQNCRVLCCVSFAACYDRLLFD